MKHIARRELLRGTGVVALAGVLAPSMAMARPSLEDQVLVFADKLLSDRSGGLTCGEWIERKRIARAVQALVTDHVTPWTESELDLMEDIRQHRPEHIWGRRS